MNEYRNYDDKEINRGLWQEQLGAILAETGIDVPGWVLEGIVDELATNGMAGKAKPFDDIHGRLNKCNSIPGHPGGGCHRLLIVRCNSTDKLGSRLVETFYHAGIYCRGENKEVVFITAQWNPKDFAFHKAAMQVLSREGVRFAFILASENGFSQIRV